MDKKAVNEIKKLFEKENCRVDRLRCCYVNSEKEHAADISESFGSLMDEEQFKYCAIFRKALSGRFGRNLHNVEFPLESELSGGGQEFLLRLLESGLKDDDLVHEFFERVIAAYRYPGKYLILLVNASYDVPGRTLDGIGLEDASEYVYSFLQATICPVDLLKEGLCFDEQVKTFVSRTAGWGVGNPAVSFLFPAFDDRQTNLHAALYYTKDQDGRHEELADLLLGAALPRAEAEEKDMFRAVLEETLGTGCDFDIVKNVADSVNKLVEEGKDSEEPVTIDKRGMRRILEENGAGREALERFEQVYEEQLGEEEEPILAEHIGAPKLSVKTENLALTLKAECSDLIETRVIDGVEYFLIPVTDDVMVNGIHIKNKSR